MRERTARLIGWLLAPLVRVLPPPPLPPQPVAVERPLAAPPPRPAPICRCERERILQRRRARWVAAYGIDAALHRVRPEEISR